MPYRVALRINGQVRPLTIQPSRAKASQAARAFIKMWRQRPDRTAAGNLETGWDLREHWSRDYHGSVFIDTVSSTEGEYHD